MATLRTGSAAVVTSSDNLISITDSDNQFFSKESFQLEMDERPQSGIAHLKVNSRRQISEEPFEELDVNVNIDQADVKNMIRRLPIVDKMTLPLARFRATAGVSTVSRSIKRCRRSLSKITQKVVRADKTWVGCMIILGTIDFCLNLANFVQMSDDSLNYGLVIGPPSKVLWRVLLGFTVLSSILYVLETLNSISVLYSPLREPFLAIPYEMTTTLLLKHIPLTTVVYFVGRCRREYTTSLESVCNAFRIVYILLRMVWYANLEGRKLKQNDKHAFHEAFVLLCCLLYGVAASFAIKNWRNEPRTTLKRYHLINVSIIMLYQPFLPSNPFPPEELLFEYEISKDLEKQGYDLEKPWLVKSAWMIKKWGSLTADYNCSKRKEDDSRPPACEPGVAFLRFKFDYNPATYVLPYGEISFNYAQINSSESLGCVEASQPLDDRWLLYYLEIKRQYHNCTRSCKALISVKPPFRKSWTHPRPRHNLLIKLCQNDTPITMPIEYGISKFKTGEELKNIKKFKTSYFSDSNYSEED